MKHVILSILGMLLVVPCVCAQSQRMVLAPSIYRVPAEESIRLAAYCVDHQRDAPRTSDRLRYVLGTPSACTVQFGGEAMSLNDAIEENLVSINGVSLSLMEQLQLLEDTEHEGRLSDTDKEILAPILTLYRMTTPERRKNLSDLFSLRNLIAMYRNEETRYMLPDEYWIMVKLYDESSTTQRTQLERDWQAVASLLLDSIEEQLTGIGDWTSVQLVNRTSAEITVTVRSAVVVGESEEDVLGLHDLLPLLNMYVAAGSDREKIQQALWQGVESARFAGE